MVTERCLALALMTGGAGFGKGDVKRYAKILGVMPRSVYRYQDKIERAKFMIRDYHYPDEGGDDGVPFVQK